jgi:hypothetical protein
MTHRTLAALTFLFLLVGRAAAEEPDLTPELRLAAIIRQFQKSADDFTAARGDVVRLRQSVLDRTEEAAVRSRINADQKRTLWQVAGERDKVALLDGVLAASASAAKSLEALSALADEHRTQLAKLESKSNFRQDKLTAAAKALTALGSPESLADLAKFYVSYVAQTRDAIGALQKAALNPPPASGAPATTSAGSAGGAP